MLAHFRFEARLHGGHPRGQREGVEITEHVHRFSGFHHGGEIFGVLFGEVDRLGYDEAEVIARCVREDNAAALVKVPGVGKKTAERLIIELRDKLSDWHTDGAPLSELEAASQPAPSGPSSKELIAEAESALIALGYKPAEATRSVARAASNVEFSSSEELIRLALRGMVPA